MRRGRWPHRHNATPLVMKILFTSYVFAPGIGGIETVSALLAPEFVRAGHEVILVTKTSGEDLVSRPYEVVRNPGFSKSIKLMRWCDVFFQNHISLELAWPLLLVSRPWIVAHHSWLDPAGGVKVRLKRLLLRYGRHASISHPVADSLPVPSTIVGNPYDTEVFRLLPGIDRDRELVYLGRLVSDKGIDLLIDALAKLRQRGFTPRLTIVGSGPEMVSLREQGRRLGVGDQIRFTGSKTGVELAQCLNAHEVMIIPSRWAEPFGVVALEGIACGCMIIASRNGGLPEAVGPCGTSFETGNCIALADAMEEALAQPQVRVKAQREASTHLAHFTPSEVAGRYLQLFEQSLSKRPG